MAKDSTVTVLFEVTELRTDPTPYKIYSPVLKPERRLFIAFEIPESRCMEISEDKIVLHRRGLLEIVGKWTTEIKDFYKPRKDNVDDES